MTQLLVPVEVGVPEVAPVPLAPVSLGAREALRRYWTNIGRPASLGLRIPILYAPIGAIGPLLLDQPANDAPFMAWVGVAVAGELALIAAFLVARPLVHRRSDPDDSRPLATLIALVAATVIRGVVVATLAAELSGESMQAELGYRLTAAVLFQAGFLTLIALNVHTHDDHRRLVATLEDRRRQLVELDASAQQRLNDMQRIMVDEVRTTIEPQVERLLAAATAVTDRESQVASARAFADFVDVEVRPLSHRLASTAHVDMKVDLRSIPRTSVRARLPRRVALGDCIIITVSVWLILVTGIVGAIRNSAPGGQLVFIVMMAVPLPLALLITRQLAASWVLPTPLAIGIVIAVTTGASTLSAIALLFIGNAPARVPVAAFAVGLGIGASSAVTGAVNRARRDVEMQLVSAVARLQASINVLQQKAWVLRRRLGYVTHGAIQGALHSAAMRLSGQAPCDEHTIEVISRDIRGALDKLESVSFEDIVLGDVLDDISSLWDGQCAVHWTMEKQASRLLADRAETSACIGEIVREAVANAVHHGEATQITIKIWVEAMLLYIEVADNGVHAGDSQSAGLGTQMLDEMCLEWSRRRAGNGTVLSATLGLGT